MKAKVTKAFDGRPDNEPLARTIGVGEEVEGDLAAVAVRDGNAKEIAEDSDAPKPKGKAKG